MNDQRLTIMYRPDLPKDRVRELIGSDDASIVCWDDVFVERNSLTQRCRELESKCDSLHEDNRHLHQVNLDWADRYVKLERDINALQSENKQLKTLLNQKELPCT